MPNVLLIAATERELDGRDGLVCGIGPVEAASATARALALGEWRAVLHIGVAGGRGLEPGSLVIGTEAVYSDLAAEIEFTNRVSATPRLLAAARAALPDVPALPIATSAAVNGARDGVLVEAMEGFGVLRAAGIAGVPAIEIRAISNAIGERDRRRWEIGKAITALSSAVPALIDAITVAGATPRGS